VQREIVQDFSPTGLGDRVERIRGGSCTGHEDNITCPYGNVSSRFSRAGAGTPLPASLSTISMVGNRAPFLTSLHRVQKNAQNAQPDRNTSAIIPLPVVSWLFGDLMKSDNLPFVHGPFVHRSHSALVPVHARNPFRMHSYENSAHKSLRIHSYKIIELKVPWNEYLQKKGGGGYRLPATSSRFARASHLRPPQQARVSRHQQNGVIFRAGTKHEAKTTKHHPREN
jgi:hypothetical protein